MTAQAVRDDDARRDAHRASRRQTTRRAVHTPTLLIVDDNSDTRELYALWFRSRGFTVVLAHDGVTGVDAAVKRQPDVIIMDLSMPGLDGVSATRQLKRDPHTRHIPVLILTGFPARAIDHGALEAGADSFLTKPCLPEDLEHHVRKLLPVRRGD